MSLEDHCTKEYNIPLFETQGNEKFLEVMFKFTDLGKLEGIKKENDDQLVKIERAHANNVVAAPRLQTTHSKKRKSSHGRSINIINNKIYCDPLQSLDNSESEIVINNTARQGSVVDL
uniref:Uncharacterized protein n=1 Tax=Glossina austeni TaxID=7395 RepID=A0A1A9VD65_GLOAU